MTDLPEGFVPALLRWYGENARALPWRDKVTPYRVWVSEIMLQQTRIEAALGYFLRFTQALPDVKALAAAPEEQVLKLWEGLGYYSRARNLHRAAKRVVAEYNGALPDEFPELRKLPGIGDYTAGAIASIAFGKPEPAVDGNVLRVLSRLCSSELSVGEGRVKSAFRELLRKVYPAGRCAAFTQALMELGEVICTPGRPDCSACPLSSLCLARAEGKETALPVMPDKKTRRIEERTVFLLRHGERFAIRKRPDRGLLAGLYEFPNMPGAMSPREAQDCVKGWGCLPGDAEPCPPFVHVFTHMEWHMTGYIIPCSGMGRTFLWVTMAELAGFALPSAFRPLLRVLEAGQPLNREEST
jgi:A/G-specific adenine glycosylase